MTTITKANVASEVAAVIPSTYHEYKSAVEAAGGTIVDKAYTAAAFAFAAKWGITRGFAVSPSFGVRTVDGVVETLYGLFGSIGIADPYIPDSPNGDFPVVTKDGFNALHYPAIVQGLAFSPTFSVSTAITACVALRSPTANTAIEGYLVTQGEGANVARRVSISNEPTGGASRLRTQVGTSAWNTAFGATKEALDRWKVSGVHCSTTQIKAIEDGAVAATTASTLLLATTYRARIGFDASGSGGSVARPAEAWFGEAWSIPDSTEAFALALAARMRAKYEL